ncbi:Ig-like domain-containing protein, partial [Flavobacterium ustbae]
SYTVTFNNGTCTSAASAPASVTVNPLPAAPSISAGGATTFCSGGNVVLTSSSSSGNQWFRDGSAISGATNSTYTAASSGSYTVTFNNGTCTSAASAPASVTVNPLPAAPSISAGGATTFCSGGNVVLTSSASSGNQWFRDG